MNLKTTMVDACADRAFFALLETHQPSQPEGTLLILSSAQQLNQAVKEVLVEAFRELCSSLILEDGDDIRPLNELIEALEKGNRAAPVHHLVFGELKNAVLRENPNAIRRLVSCLERGNGTACHEQTENNGQYSHVKFALAEMASQLGIEISIDTQWHAANAQLLKDSRKLMVGAAEEFAHAVEEILPEVVVFNTLGASNFDCATLYSANFQGLLFVNRADVTAPLAMANILARHAGISFAVAWLATDPELLGQNATAAGKWNSSLALDEASDLLLCAIGSAWQAIWEHHLSISGDAPKEARAQHEANSWILKQDYMSRMQYLATSHDLMTELMPLAVLTENIMDNAGVSLTTRLS